MIQKIGFVSDHAGAEAKLALMHFVEFTTFVVSSTSSSESTAERITAEQITYEPLDLSRDVTSQKSVDYPDYAAKLSKAIIAGECERGIAICGTGIGMSISANRFYGIRAAVVWDEFTAKMAAAHNHANILCLGARCFDMAQLKNFVSIWLQTPPEQGNHVRRVNKIDKR